MERIKDTSVASSIAQDFRKIPHAKILICLLLFYNIFFGTAFFKKAVFLFCFLKMTNKSTDYFIVAHFILLSHSIHIGVILG